MRLPLVAAAAGGVSFGQPSKAARSEISARWKAGAVEDRIPEGVGSLEEIRVAGEAEIKRDEGIDGRTRDEEVVSGCLGANVELESANGAHGQTREGRDDRIGEEALGGL